MDYEMKYKAVLKTATQWIKDGCTDKEKICLECVFPELAESEDERIMKEMIEYHKQQFEKNRDQEIGLLHKDALAYLEKQKEQKQVENPKKGCPTYPLSVVGDLLAKTPQEPIEFVPEQKPAEWSEDEKVRKFLLRLVKRCPENSTDFLGEVKKADVLAWLKFLRPSWRPSEEQIANATYNDLAEVYERIRTEMLRRHRDIAINIKEGQQ